MHAPAFALHTTIAVLLVGSVACSTQPPAAVNAVPSTGRPMYQMDAQHTGRSPHTGPRSLMLLRTFNTARVEVPDPTFATSDIQSSAAIASDGTAYVGLHNGTLFALRDPGTGNQLAARWSFHPPGASSWHATPAISADGTVYVGFSTDSTSPTTAEGVLYALRSPTAGIEPQVVWTVDLGPGRQTSSPIIGPDGTIYIVSGVGRLSAIAPDGQVRWTAQTGPTLKSSAALGPDGTLYVPSMNGKLYAVAPPPDGGQTGVVRWTFRFAEVPGPGEPVISHSPPAGADGVGSGASPTIAPDGTIYVGANNSNFYALAPDGRLLWYVPAEREIAGIWSTAALSADGSTLYFGANKGGIYAVNRDDGSLRWQHPIVGSIYSSPALDAAGVLYTGSTAGHVIALDAATGATLFDYAAGAAIWTAPAIRPDGTLLVADRTGRVMLLGEG